MEILFACRDSGSPYAGAHWWSPIAWPCVTRDMLLVLVASIVPIDAANA